MKFFLRATSVALLLGFTMPSARCDEGSDSNELYYYRYTEPGEPKSIECDVAVYGGTPAGVAAAIQAARMGRKVVLLSFNKHVGGLTSGGLTATDIGKKESIGGLAKEFYARINRISNFRPSEAESLFRKMLDEAGVNVLLRRCLESVEKKDTRVISARMNTGEAVKASMFVDATYEGDLLAAANVSYQVGREPANTYGESLGGQWQKVSWKDVYQFCRLPISPYVVPDDPASGLLREISSEPAGKPGEGDYRVQAYNFRMYLSDKAGNIPFPKPRGYDAGRYALLARFLNLDSRIKWLLNYTVQPMTDGPVQMRNGDSNNAGSFSSDYVGGNHRWPDGTYEPVSFAKLSPPRRGLPVPLNKLYELRERIFQDHVNYQQGLMYFLANDPQVPKQLQGRVKRFGLDPKEFEETGHWPHQLYVREGRRMVSSYVMTQANCESKRTVEDSVGLASYAMDSHFCQRVVVKENGKLTVRNEGGFGHGFAKPYPVSFRSIVPKKEECTNLLVPLCLSSSHVAYGSIRMEPVFMILGQSAGTAASLAIEAGRLPVQEVDITRLQDRLKAEGQILYYGQSGKPGGIIVDDSQAKLEGHWKLSTLRAGYGNSYQHDSNTRDGKAVATFTARLPAPGKYEVQLAYTPNPNRATNVPVAIVHRDGTVAFRVNQQQKPSLGIGFHSLGVFSFDRSGTVTISNTDTNGHVIIDAVRWVPTPD